MERDSHGICHDAWHGRVSMSNLLQKLISDRSRILFTITDPDIESLKFFQTLFDKYNMLVIFIQNRMIQNIQNFELFGKKWLAIFDKALTTF